MSERFALRDLCLHPLVQHGHISQLIYLSQTLFKQHNEKIFSNNITFGTAYPWFMP